MRLAGFSAAAFGFFPAHMAVRHRDLPCPFAGTRVVDVEFAVGVESAQGGDAVADASEQDGEFGPGGDFVVVLEFSGCQEFHDDARDGVGTRVEVE
jgi:hypothetical protein